MYQRDSGNRIFHQQRCLLDVKDLVLLLLCFLCFSTTELEAAVYQVGSDQEYHQVENVPWEKLMAGDEVHIHWRPQPYQTKWVLCCRGTKDKPIVIKGIPSPIIMAPTAEVAA
ncbi:MAG: hypothetical protein P1V19_07870, partial [Gimesia sp.]|nr:hypothetical protein [Gimesia sp.]